MPDREVWPRDPGGENALGQEGMRKRHAFVVSRLIELVRGRQRGGAKRYRRASLGVAWVPGKLGERFPMAILEAGVMSVRSGGETE
jgi:hypothetical protein